jgi:hypothetical protein
LSQVVPFPTNIWNASSSAELKFLFQIFPPRILRVWLKSILHHGKVCSFVKVHDPDVNKVLLSLSTALDEVETEDVELCIVKQGWFSLTPQLLAIFLVELPHGLHMLRFCTNVLFSQSSDAITR